VNLYAGIVSTFGGLAVVALVSSLILAGVLSSSRGRRQLRRTVIGMEVMPLGIALFVAFLAASGSLYLSDIVHLIPCELCWYQRIAMYPLVPILGVALLRGDLSVWLYGLPLSLSGLAISAYHVTIQWMPTLQVGTCEIGASCTGRYVAVFGFVSIPTMAGAAFLFVSLLLVATRVLAGAAAADGSEVRP
jgi:disulfide bond formation protein DsbB